MRRRTSTGPGSSAAVAPCAPARFAAEDGDRRSAPAVALQGRRNQLSDLLGRLRRLQVRADDLADGVDGGGLAIDQDGEVAGGDRLHGDHRTASSHPGRERRRVPAEEETPRQERIGGGLGAERRILWVLGHEDRLRPGPRADGGACGAPERGGRLAEDGQHVAGLEWDEPGPLCVVADGKHDGQVREGRVVTLEGTVAHVPRRVVLDAHEGPGRLFRMHPVETERDAGVRHADGPDGRAGGCTVEGQAQPAVGGLE